MRKRRTSVRRFFYFLGFGPLDEVFVNDSLFADLDITSAELEGRRARGDEFLLVDVRELWEWEYNRIPGARHLPLSELEARSDELTGSPTPIVFYCHHGMRSQQAAIWLRQQGRPDCVSLAGGIAAWADDTDSDMPRY